MLLREKKEGNGLGSRYATGCAVGHGRVSMVFPFVSWLVEQELVDADRSVRVGLVCAKKTVWSNGPMCM